jgi:hypothetical protein
MACRTRRSSTTGPLGCHPSAWRSGAQSARRSARGPGPGAGRGGFASLSNLDRQVQDPHFAFGLSSWWSPIAQMLGAPNQLPYRGSNVPRCRPKAKFSRPISWEIFQPFALATPLYPVSLRLSGGELLRVCSVVCWPAWSAGPFTSSSCLLFSNPLHQRAGTRSGAQRPPLSRLMGAWLRRLT